jgi:hypothetical protein
VTWSRGVPSSEHRVLPEPSAVDAVMVAAALRRRLSDQRHLEAFGRDGARSTCS